MKPPTRAPFFACMYHGLCETARKHGYALAIHGTVTADLDLIAVPWTDEAAPAEVVKDALMEHIAAVDYEGLTRRHLGDENLVQQVLANERARKEVEDATGATIKPHGRRAWNLYMDHGAKVDLSVMPRVTGVGGIIRPANVSAECCNDLRSTGKPTPRTCGICGLGPCTKGNP